MLDQHTDIQILTIRVDFPDLEAHHCFDVGAHLDILDGSLFE